MAANPSDAELAERWASIPSAPGYEASSLGRVRSVDRTIVRTDGALQHRRGRLLHPAVNNDGGYLAARIARRLRYVHAVVLEAFVGPAPDGAECRHDNGDPQDNRLTNLRWGTKSENSQDQVRHGSHNMSRKTHCPRRHLLVEPNLVPSVLRKGYRECLACSRANSRRRAQLAKTGVEIELAPIADAYYAELTRGTRPWPFQPSSTPSS